MINRDTLEWQTILKRKGFYDGDIDGDFGPGTLAASYEALGIDPQAAEDAHGRVSLVMNNHAAIRNRPITLQLTNNLLRAAGETYDAGQVKLVVYSGGQDRRGHGTRRTGSIRHDDYGDGGRAADLYVYLDGRKLTGVDLARLGQYWLAKGLGGCGLEMATGGIHLDDWTTPPPGGGMFWTYSYSDQKPWGAQVRAMLASGVAGKLPA
ncbi:peptidoglycan-binding protein [Roseovarius mucosus]|uniref:peptidoglycan-binding domain-containing protein n=1 Tax=Roseovarius mucosus TaxID=215743 RepID=UPI0035CF78B3